MTTDTGGDSSMAGTKDQAQEAHRMIQEATRRLGSAPDLRGLLQRLHELRLLIAPHFTDEERPDGFFDLIRARSARHLGAVKQLETEHQAFLGAIDGLAEQARACLAGPVAHILKEGAELARRMHEHEAREDALLGDALYIDIGEEE
jgi:hypothetical protein